MPAALPRSDRVQGTPLRLAFVGQQTYFAACALGDEHPDVTTAFVDFRKDADPAPVRAALDAFAPDVVVVFRPEHIPAGLLRDVPALTLGFLTEPLPRLAGGGATHADLERRYQDLREVDPGNFDRVVSFDPLIAATAHEVVPVWRSLPLPVADRFYRPVEPMRPDPRMLFVGRSTPHRESILRSLKHHHDLMHVAHGVDGDELERLLGEFQIGINLHNEPYPSFENRVCLHLAAGHLVVTGHLSPTHGLEPGIDYLEHMWDHVAHVVRRSPRTWDRVRHRGRRKAEQFRASRVWPRLVADLRADVHAFGTNRAPAVVPRSRVL
jgi:hypothetical protein